MHDVEIWVLVDAAGDYECASDPDAAEERYGENIGGGLAGSRLVKIVLQIEVPCTVEVAGTVPAQAKGPILLVAEGKP